MWYVFPQLRLGTSDHSVKYAINGADEAIAYLNDPVLRNRLLEIALATAEQLAAGADPDSLMGGNADCTKLRSSMTLFDVASASCGDEEIREVCRRVLELLAATGIGPCPMTLKMLADPYIS